MAPSAPLNKAGLSSLAVMIPSLRVQLIMSLTMLLMFLPTVAAAAAHTKEPSPMQPEPEKQPTSTEDVETEVQESAEHAQRIELYDLGDEKYKQKDFLGAIGPWQRLYEMVPLCERAQLFGPLATAHWEAYQTDMDEEHLHQAKKLFERNLEATSAADGQTRHDAKEQLDDVVAELDRLEAKRLQYELDAAVLAAVARAEALRQKKELEERKARLEDERRRFGVHVRAGGSVAGLGVVSLATAAVGLRLGEGVDREGAKLFDNPNARPDEFQDLLGKGQAYNRLAVATGVLGSALLISGTTVLIVAAVRLRGARSLGRMVVGQSGLEVRF